MRHDRLNLNYDPLRVTRLLMFWRHTDHNHFPRDKIGHGTACSGIVGAVGNNNIGISGVCWNCKIMSLQVFDENIEFLHPEHRSIPFSLVRAQMGKNVFYF